MVARIAACVIAMLAGQSARAQTEIVLHSFAGGNYNDGANPRSGVIRDAEGNLYGTTQNGNDLNRGAVFKLSNTGEETFLYAFTGGADGGWPQAGMIQGAKGNLFYGADIFGGNGACTPLGCGMVFEIGGPGQLTVLYSFTGWADGAFPMGVIQDAQGNLYGTTLSGGSGHNGSCSLYRPHGCGTVFKVDPSGNKTVLHSFTGDADGGYPEAGLIQDAEGNLYGTTSKGGSPDCGCGVVFKLDKEGKETVLYRFKGRDGANPYAGLIQDAQGNLYGTTYGGGAYDGGTIFRLSKSGKEKVLYSFCRKWHCADGAGPYAGVIQDARGNLYGTTLLGGGGACYGCGTVFKLDPEGREIVLHSFAGAGDGWMPYAGVIQDAKGNLYGTTYYGGRFDYGVVFELTPN